MARLLAKAGAAVTVVSVGEKEPPAAYETDFTLVPVTSLPASAHPVWAIRVASNLVRNRMRRIALKRAVVKAVRETGAQAVHCMNLDTLLVGFRAACGAPVIYDSREHFATTGDVKRHTRLWWMLKERLLIHRAAAVLTVSEPIAEDLASRYSILKPTVIYNGCTEFVESPSAVHQPLRLLHLGKYFFDRNLSELIDAVAALAGNVELTLQGWGEADQALKHQVESLGVIDLVRFTSPCPPGQVTSAIVGQDVGVINFRPDNASFRWSAPNKLFDYMGGGLCVVAPDLPVMRGIVESADCGVVFPAGSAAELAKVISYLASHPDEVARYKQNAVTAARRYSWDSQAEMLYAVYTKALIGSRSTSRSQAHRAADDLRRS